jgi:hypothetical protein
MAWAATPIDENGPHMYCPLPTADYFHDKSLLDLHYGLYKNMATKNEPATNAFFLQTDRAMAPLKSHPFWECHNAESQCHHPDI